MTKTSPHRIEIAHSNAHVEVRRDGKLLADTRRPMLLHEGSLPTRFYIPREDVQMDLLAPSSTRTHCPYKGDATYWSTSDVDDIAWSYEDPIDGAEDIASLICFYNEKTDIIVDGTALDRPETRWS